MSSLHFLNPNSNSSLHNPYLFVAIGGRSIENSYLFVAIRRRSIIVCVLWRLIPAAAVEDGGSTGYASAGDAVHQPSNGDRERKRVPSYSLESKLGDCFKTAKIRREAVQKLTGRSVEGLPLEGFYDSILGQCCEMLVGYVQIPVGIVGPLLLNGCVSCNSFFTETGTPSSRFR